MGISMQSIMESDDSNVIFVKKVSLHRHAYWDTFSFIQDWKHFNVKNVVKYLQFLVTCKDICKNIMVEHRIWTFKTKNEQWLYNCTLIRNKNCKTSFNTSIGIFLGKFWLFTEYISLQLQKFLRKFWPTTRRQFSLWYSF